MTIKKLVFIFFIGSLTATILGFNGLNAQNWSQSDWEQFHQQALEESTIPIRPGVPNNSPFWNPYSRSFIHVPSFEFNIVGNAVQYLFTATSDENNKNYTFQAELPWNPLTPIWKELPVGIIYLKVDGLDANGKQIGTAGERLFYKAAPFHGPYHARVIDYTSSAKLNLKSLFNQKHYQHWLTEPTPDPDYYLYCYPSKIIGSIVEGMALYSRLSPEDKEDALAIARNAALYLIQISQPKGTVLEYFPPTYAFQDNSTKVARERIGQMMMFYPAVVGSAFLDLYEIIHEKKFLDEAIRIAETYQKRQLTSGTWPLMADIKTGEAISENFCVPTDIISFLDRLIKRFGIAKLSITRENAFNWIYNNPMKTFHWEGQFEDMGYSKNYSNMERGKPLAFAKLLLEKAEEKPEYIAMAEELICFAEDQFVVWERPLPREMFRTKERPIPKAAHTPEKWMTPCALEQYDYYTPIDASASSAIMAFKKAYEITGKELYLAKAISLADAQTYYQDLGGGIYPTYQMDLKKEAIQPEVWKGWINCATGTSIALLELDKTLKGYPVKPKKYVAFSADTEANFTPRDFDQFQGEYTQQILDVCEKYNIPYTWLIIVDKEHIEVREMAEKYYPSRKGKDEFSLHTHFKWFIMDRPDDFESFKKIERRMEWLKEAKAEIIKAGLPMPQSFRYGGGDSQDRLYCIEDLVFLVDSMGIKNFLFAPDRLKEVIGLERCNNKGNNIWEIDGGRELTLLSTCVFLDKSEEEVIKSIDDRLNTSDYAIIGCHDYREIVPKNMESAILHINKKYNVEYVTVDQIGELVRQGKINNPD